MADQKQNLAEIARKKRYLHLVQKLHDGKALSKQEIAELEQFEAEPLGPTIVKSIVEVAEVMGISYRTAQRWKKAGMPMTKVGFYDLEEIKDWHLKRNETNKIKEGKDYWDEKIKKYRATLLKLAVKKETEELISRKEVKAEFEARLLALTRSIGALPREAAPAMEGMDVKQREAYLTERIEDIRNQFAEPIFGGEDNGENQGRRQDDLESGREGNLEISGEDNSQ